MGPFVTMQCSSFTVIGIQAIILFSLQFMGFLCLSSICKEIKVVPF